MSTPLPQRQVRRPRRGFTLIELVVSVAIIGILATILLGVAGVATVTARESRTKSMITRLHTLLIERFDGYRNRRVELNTNDVNGNQAADWFDNATLTNTGIDFNALDTRVRLAAGRVVALRELMKLEMPDRWSEVYGGVIPVGLSDINLGNPVPVPNLFLGDRPALWSRYAREYNRINGLTNSLTGDPNTQQDILENQGAELLYLTIINATGDGEARSLFREEDAGDTDGDGALEFLDGWGQPITLVRWPAGFESDMQLDAPDLMRRGAVDQEDVFAAIRDDHDPYDLFRVDNPGANALRGWRQTPLILSAGRDGEFGLLLEAEPQRPVDPFAAVVGGGWLGSLGDDLDVASDNLHNHALSDLSRTR